MERCRPRGTVKSRTAVDHHHHLSLGCLRVRDEKKVTRRTIGGPRKIGVQVVFVPASSLVVATQDIGCKRVHASK